MVYHMTTERVIQVCVARADLFLCAVAAFPWWRVLLAVVAAALAWHSARTISKGNRG